jgi:hypothetical protein
MKLKKLLKVLAYKQRIRIVLINGSEIIKDQVQFWDDYYRPLKPNIAEYHVISVRHVHDECRLPDYQDYIEIKIQGGN